VEIIRREKALNIPNLLTILRIALLPAVVWRCQKGDSVGALGLYLAAMLTDIVDGFAARRMNQITALGKILDPIADKLFQLTLLVLFASAGRIPAWVVGFSLMKEIVLLSGGAAALYNGMIVCALPVGKISTFAFVLSAAAQFLSFHEAADILMNVFVLLSMVSLAWYSVAWGLNMCSKKAGV